MRSADDTLNDVLPGVTLQLGAADPDTVVTVTVTQDGNALADKVSALVDAANQAVSFIAARSSYDPDTKQAGVFLSDGLARTLQNQVYSAISDVVAGAKLGAPGSTGIALVKDGTITFDRSAFLAAYAKDPDAVAGLFRAGGSATDSHVSFLTASATTKAGTYAVHVTQPLNAYRTTPRRARGAYFPLLSRACTLLYNAAGIHVATSELTGSTCPRR